MIKLQGKIQESNDIWGPRPSKKQETQAFKKNIRFLQTNKKLTYLSLALNPETSFDFHFLLSRFQYLQSVSTLDLNITDREHLTVPNIRILSFIIANLKNLTAFYFQHPENFQVSFKLIDAIFFALKRLSSLSRLTLKFNSHREFGDAHIQKLALHLTKLPKLHSLIIYIQNSTEITNTGLQPLSLAFKNLPSLSEVSIQLLYSPSSSASTFQELFSGLATLKFLKKLELFIRPDSGCYFIEPIPHR